MTFFKLNGTFSSSKKNKTASAANTPSQTPRTSVHLTGADLAAVNKNTAITPETLEAHFVKANMGHMQALSMSRIQAKQAKPAKQAKQAQQAILQPILSSQHTLALSTQLLNTFPKTTTMSLFKVSKNKIASAASTPAQTPRSSLQINTSDANMTTVTPADVGRLLKKTTTIGHNQALSLARM